MVPVGIKLSQLDWTSKKWDLQTFSSPSPLRMEAAGSSDEAGVRRKQS